MHPIISNVQFFPCTVRLKENKRLDENIFIGIDKAKKRKSLNVDMIN